MTHVVGNYETDLFAYKAAAFKWTFPDILVAASGLPIAVQNRAGSASDPTRWDVTLANFPAGMQIVRYSGSGGARGVADRSSTGYLAVSTGLLSDLELQWTPTAGQSFFVEDGTQKRPRIWPLAIQVDGTGNWVDTQYELGLAIRVSDRRVVAVELRDEESIREWGEHRQVGLPWYQFDDLAQAAERRYRRPPRMVVHNVPFVQESLTKLTEVVGIEPGDFWLAGTSPLNVIERMAAVVTSCELQIGAGGAGLSYKRVTLIEQFRDEARIALEINGVPIAFQGHVLNVGSI